MLLENINGTKIEYTHRESFLGAEHA